MIELLGLGGKPSLTSKLRLGDKLALGTAATGVLVSVSGVLPQVLLYEIFLYEYEELPILVTVSYIGGLTLLCGLSLLIFGGAQRRKVLLGWADKVGWGKLGSGWINKLGLGLIVIGVIGATLELHESTTIIAGAGIAIIVVGFVSHLLVGGRP